MSTPDKPKVSVGSEYRSLEGKPSFLAEDQAFHGQIAEDVTDIATSVGSAAELAGIHRRIAALRSRAKLTQEALAQAVLVSLTAVKAWEAGRSVPRLEQAVKLAEALGVSLDTLALGADAATARRVAPSMEEVDQANLIYALNWAEKAIGQGSPAVTRVELMLSTAAEFRRFNRIPQLPALDASLLARCLDFAEAALDGRATTEARVSLMLTSYAAAAAMGAVGESEVKPTS